MYHKWCLVDLYNKAKLLGTPQTSSDSHLDEHWGIAFAELVMYLEEKWSEEPHIIKRAEAVSLYRRWLDELGQIKEGRENSRRLKKKFLTHILGLTAHKKGWEVLQIMDTSWNHLIKCDGQNSYHRGSNFGWSCQSDLFRVVQWLLCVWWSFQRVPLILQSFISMLLEGPSITEKSNRKAAPACLSITQL